MPESNTICMKKIFIVLFVCVVSVLPTSAQDVLNEIMRTSLATTNDTTLSKEERKVAVFKYDATTYLRSKVLLPGDLLSDSIDVAKLNANIKMLNEQAYAMYQYVGLYLKRLAEAKKRNKSMVKSLFKEATANHRLFGDKDEELTLAYYRRDDYPIQFCIDCDWVKTLAFIRSIDWSKI